MYTYIITDKRETKKNYEFAVTLSFMFNQFQTALIKTYFYRRVTFN